MTYGADGGLRVFRRGEGCGSYASRSVVFRILYLTFWGDTKFTTSSTLSGASMPGAGCEAPDTGSLFGRFGFFFRARPVFAPSAVAAEAGATEAGPSEGR